MTVATAKALIKQLLDGSADTVTDLGAAGNAAAPVRLGSCPYAAWAGSQKYVRDCDKPQTNPARTSPPPAPADFMFRVNSNVVVLNDIYSGDV